MNRTRTWFTVGGIAWGLAALVQLIHRGLLGLLNPFGWIKAWMEGIEGIAYLLGGGDPLGLLVAALNLSPEALYVLAGLIGLIGWLTTAVGIITLRGHESRRFVLATFALNFFFQPWGVVAYWARQRSTTPDTPTTA